MHFPFFVLISVAIFYLAAFFYAGQIFLLKHHDDSYIDINSDTSINPMSSTLIWDIIIIGFAALPILSIPFRYKIAQESSEFIVSVLVGAVILFLGSFFTRRFSSFDTYQDTVLEGHRPVSTHLGILAITMIFTAVVACVLSF